VYDSNVARAAKPAQKQTLGVADFKARCLELLDGVGTRGDEIIITKRGKPIATVLPIRRDAPLKGLFAGQIKIVGDIVNVDWTDEWEATR
jgi:prevent-host-death family protein